MSVKIFAQKVNAMKLTLPRAKTSTAVIIAATSMMQGCGGPPPNMNVRQVWGDSIKNYGITPFYPMREDVFVGDVFLVVEAPCRKSNIPARNESALLGSINPIALQKYFFEFYGQRAVYPKTAQDPRPKNPNEVASSTAQSVASTTEPIFAPSARPFDRLRLAAFPSISLGRVSRGDLAVTAPAGGGLGRFLGLSAEDHAAVSVGVSNVEEVQLPLPTMVRAISEFLESNDAKKTFDPGDISEIVTHLKLRHVESAAACVDTPSPPKVVFINRVFYARAIEFDFGEGSATNFAIGAALAKGDAVTVRPKFSGPPNNQDQNQTSQNAITNLDAEGKSILNTLTGLAGSQTPGISATIGIGQFGNMVLRQSFDRPLAFGVDFSITYDLVSVLNTIRTGIINSNISPDGQVSQLRASASSNMVSDVTFYAQNNPRAPNRGQTPQDSLRIENWRMDQEKWEEVIKTINNPMPRPIPVPPPNGPLMPKPPGAAFQFDGTTSRPVPGTMIAPQGVMTPK